MSSGHQRITWRRNIAENFNRLSRVHERYRRQTDRRQTDGRRHIANMNMSSRSLKTGVGECTNLRCPCFLSSQKCTVRFNRSIASGTNPLDQMTTQAANRGTCQSNSSPGFIHAFSRGPSLNGWICVHGVLD